MGMMRWAAAGLAAMLIPLPASATSEQAPTSVSATEWVHHASGISLPLHIGAMHYDPRLDRDLSNGQAADIGIQYGGGDLHVTVYVYRGSHPNPALWFNRTLTAMKQNVGDFDGTPEPRSFTLAQSPRPNGLRGAYDIATANEKHFKSTAMAMAQIGQWMLKIRITSASLDRQATDKLMDQMLSAARFAKPVTDPLPLVEPLPCGDMAFETGKAVKPNEAEQLAPVGAVQAILVQAWARGTSGMAKEPERWCRMKSQIPAEFAATYRSLDDGHMVALLGDGGRTAAVTPLEPVLLEALGKFAKRRIFALFTSDPVESKLIWFFDGPPDMDRATMIAVPYLFQGQKGLVSISSRPETGTDQPLPEKEGASRP